MKKMVILVLITLVSLVLSACQSNTNDISTYNTTNASVTDTTQNRPSYTINTVVDNDENKLIEYPQLNGQSEEYTAINSLLYSEMKVWLEDEVADDATINVRYSVTFCDETYLCVLFEGDVVAPNTAHPIKVVKSVCISLIDGIVINPLDIVEIDKVFVENFKNQLNSAMDAERFTDEQWESVIAYFYTFSNEELMKKIVDGEVTLIENGALVCIEVPRAIGDYIKVSVNSTHSTGDGLREPF